MKKHLQRPFEVKSIADNGTFTGYGSVFGELDSYRDIVLPGAFAKSIATDFQTKNRKVPMLYQHRSAEPIGVYTEIKEDAHGLLVTGEINMDVQRGRETHSLMKQGALSGLSIGYETITEEWDKTSLSRKLHEVKLWEISPVTFPAGDSARVTDVKSIGELLSLSDCEDFLRDAGYSKSEATAIVSRIKAIATKQSDSVNGGDAEALKRAMQHIKSISL